MQRALSWNIAAPGRQHAQIDAYGNVVHLLTLDEPHREIRIVVDEVVDIQDKEGAPLPDEGTLSPLAYLAETLLTRADGAIVAFATGELDRTGDRQTNLLRLAGSINGAVQYETGSTDVHECAAIAGRRQTLPARRRP